MYYDSWPTSATVRCKITHNVLCVLCFLIEHSRFVMVERQDCTRILSLVTICKLSIDVDLQSGHRQLNPSDESYIRFLVFCVGHLWAILKKKKAWKSVDKSLPNI